MAAWKKDQNGQPVVRSGSTTCCTSELPLVAITAQVEVWDWILQHLPNEDTITHNIRDTVRKAVVDAFPSVMYGRTE